jgi:hypothetical protein
MTSISWKWDDGRTGMETGLADDVAIGMAIGVRGVALVHDLPNGGVRWFRNHRELNDDEAAVEMLKWGEETADESQPSTPWSEG